MTQSFLRYGFRKVFLVVAVSLMSCSAIAKKQTITTQGFSYSIDSRMPSWVTAVPLTKPWHPETPWHYVLDDQQIFLTSRGAEHYTHIIRSIDTAQGLSDGTQILINFDPSYQTLTVHTIEITRNNKKINYLNTIKLKLLQREEHLNESMYDGRITATMVIPDVRVGDKITYSYTIRGENPVLKGNFVDSDFVNAFVAPIENYTFQMIYPRERHIEYRYIGKDLSIQQNDNGALHRVSMQGSHIQIPNFDAYTPVKESLKNSIEISEFQNWNAVAKWGYDLFNSDVDKDNLVKEKAASIKKEGGTLIDQATRALDFVQKDIRYLGIELGQYSHRPEKPSKILAQRFGDCKDKSALLISLLNELGIKAEPVLVNPDFGRDTQARLPSPYAFNHAIVIAHIDNEDYWLDPTRQYQYGPLSQRQPFYGVGLVLDKNTVDLKEMPERVSSNVVISKEEVFTISDFKKPVELSVDALYYGEQAEYARAYASTINKENIEKSQLEYYAKLYPKIKRTSDYELTDDKLKNVVHVKENYQITDFMSYPETKTLMANLAYLSIASNLRIQLPAERQTDYIFGTPGRIEQDIKVKFPEDTFEKDGDKDDSVTSPYFALKRELHSTKRDIDFKEIFTLKKKVVLSKDFRDFSEKAKQGFDLTFLSLYIPAAPVPELKAIYTKAKADFKNDKDDSYTNMISLQKLKVEIATAHIDANRLTDKQHALALRQRAIAFDALGKVNSATKDISQALKLDPDNNDIYETQAEVYEGKGEFQKGLNVLNSVGYEKTNSGDNKNNHFLVGRLYYGLGNYAQAVQEFKQSFEVSENSVYPYLWFYMANLHIGKDAVSLLKTKVKDVDRSEWPGAVIDYLVGNIKKDDLIKKASDPEKTQKEHLCEAYFYMGQKALLNGDKEEAIHLFQKALDTKLYAFIEYRFAANELMKLGVNVDGYLSE